MRHKIVSAPRFRIFNRLRAPLPSSTWAGSPRASVLKNLGAGARVGSTPGERRLLLLLRQEPGFKPREKKISLATCKLRKRPWRGLANFSARRRQDSLRHVFHVFLASGERNR